MLAVASEEFGRQTMNTKQNRKEASRQVPSIQQLGGSTVPPPAQAAPLVLRK